MAYELTDEDKRINKICLDFAKNPPGELEKPPHWHDDVLGGFAGTSEEVDAYIAKKAKLEAEQRKLAKQDMVRLMAKKRATQ